MVRKSLHILLAVAIIATLPVTSTIAADESADTPFDELTLLPRNTVTVIRFASPKRLRGDIKRILATMKKQGVDLGLLKSTDRLEQSVKEDEAVAAGFTDIGALNIGDLTRPQILGMVLLPEQSPEEIKQPPGENAEKNETPQKETPQEKDAVRFAEFGVCRASDMEAVRKYLSSLDVERYKREKKSYDESKALREKIGESPFSQFNLEPLQQPEKPKQYHCISHEGWVLFTLDKRCLSLLQQAVADRKQSLSAVIDPAVRRTLMAGDISGAVNIKAIMNQAEAKEVLAEMKQGCEAYLQMIDLVEVDWKQWDLDTAQVKQYAQMAIDAVFVITQEPQWIAGQIDVTADAIVGSCVMTVRKNGFIDQFLSSRPPITLDLLEQLPRDRPFYLAHRDDQSLVRLSRSFYQRFAATVKEKRLMRSLSRVLEAQPKQTAYSVASPLRSDWGMRTLTMTEAKNPAALLEYQPLLQEHANQDGRVTYEKGFEKFGGQDVDVVINEAAKSVEEANKDLDLDLSSLGKAISGTYRETWMLARDKHFWSAGGYSWDQAKKEFEALASGKESNRQSEAFRTARANIDRRANLVALVNIPDVVLGGIKFYVKQFPLEDQLASAEPLAKLAEISKKGPQSYAAGSVAFLPGEIRARFYFPISQYAVLGVFGEIGEDPFAPRMVADPEAIPEPIPAEAEDYNSIDPRSAQPPHPVAPGSAFPRPELPQD